jgi:HSP20 family protein
MKLKVKDKDEIGSTNMTLIRWQPFNEIDSLQRRINTMFDDIIFPNYWRDNRNVTYVPAAEISETPEAVHLKLEIPGIDPKDLDIQVSKDSVSITGERKQETKTEENGTTKTEFYYGKFQRLFTLPTWVQNTSVTADYKDGVLNLTLPKMEEVKNKVVKVDIG